MPTGTYKRTEEHKRKMSEAHKGEKNPSWKGGKSFEPYSMDWTDDLKDSIRIRDDEYDEYRRKDLYYVATDSGGYSCGNLWWAKKYAQKSKRLLIKKKKKEIKACEARLHWAEEDLQKLQSTQTKTN